uniref:RdRp n=1 Tax=viral metagenome TaxID=1070528 RepID=A0A2V0RJY5_9ZZZZ
MHASKQFLFLHSSYSSIVPMPTRRLRRLRRAPAGHAYRELVTDELLESCLRELCSPEDFEELELLSRSYYDVEIHIRDFLKADFSEQPYPKPNDWSRAEAATASQLRKFGTTSLSFRASTYGFHHVKWKRGTSAGHGFVNDDGSFKKKGDPGVFQQACRMANAAFHEWRESSSDPLRWRNSRGPLDASFFRTQLSYFLTEAKVRHVFGRPFHLLLIELLFMDPLCEKFLGKPYSPFAAGLNLSQQMLLLSQLVGRDLSWCTGDWKSFDRTTLSWEIRSALNQIRSLLTFPDDQTRQAWDFVCFCFIHGRCVGPDGYEYATYGIVPSGSALTWLVDSITNLNRWNYILLHVGVRLIFPSKVLGDDFVGLLDYSVTEQDVRNAASVFATHFKFLVIGRTYDSLVFLGHQNKGGLLYRGWLEVLALACRPEFRRTPLASCQAAFALYNDSGCAHLALLRAYKLLQRRFQLSLNFESLPDYAGLY